ncbi:DSD1 family PLP-dependent enzyme [Agrobacterium vitis]|uniref:alanine racemase n=1 Tax=Agrobacterium vitis TaxID=373 RepID=UPI0008734C5F|nr:alanine racemase [Agrobacterium vitis]MCE6077333.1 DSD1 family PLP-dependent enzyme [Agrobacterium vitis]MCM2468455.1 DSD1 family PLP-dependent enzyme [Agrobacterium vitis]MUO70554.1 DSD1 family PLP-dependent enzyme [Agrobacterium vitis]MUO82726.1 DSD1 family PLP-dependent enzyme [Agrobacterium vitis]MVA33157.1 DSD1 family PLP-dependent enzyme [Agrobacterium vitis]
MVDADYFRMLSEALSQAELFRPVLVVDRDRLDANIATIARGLAPGLGLRVVDKSLASIPLLERILTQAGTMRLMSFHLPMTCAVLEAFPKAEILYGKPLPTRALAAWMRLASPHLVEDLLRRAVFLIDSLDRLDQYAALAVEVGQTIRIAFETDTGMHRGGFETPDALAAICARAVQQKELRVEGLVGYEAHIPEVAHLIGGAAEQEKVVSRIKAFVSVFPHGTCAIANTGGSKTALSYRDAGAANEVSVGSAFLKPTDFDMPSLEAVQPAVFIATPVLKVEEVRLPGPPLLTSLMQAIGLFPRKGCFLYGGKWMAKPVFPKGMRENRIWGLSSNQQMMALPYESTLKPDDFAFFRPTQSEAVLQHFDGIHVLSKGRIIETWPTLPPG